VRIHVSIGARSKGGGSNTFAGLFASSVRRTGHKLVKRLDEAEMILVIANRAKVEDLQRARDQGCFILHRLDEYFEDGADPTQDDKHRQIIDLNRLADATIYQSNFVYNNIHPHLQHPHSRIIYNGSDERRFKPARKPGKYIGHVSWGIGDKKRLDLLYDFIRANPQERFLLVGRHRQYELDFSALSNVKLVGEARRWTLPYYFRRMKMLYFPSERDPCPNTVVESILSGVPVCYSLEGGGSVELTGDCGAPLGEAGEMLASLETFRQRCLRREDLSFTAVFRQYMNVVMEVAQR
jgi:hypothetical protein